MAFVISSERFCFNCHRNVARVEVRTWDNKSLGLFCPKCGQDVLAEQQVKEKKEFPKGLPFNIHDAPQEWVAFRPGYPANTPHTPDWVSPLPGKKT